MFIKDKSKIQGKQYWIVDDGKKAEFRFEAEPDPEQPEEYMLLDVYDDDGRLLFGINNKYEFIVNKDIENADLALQIAIYLEKLAEENTVSKSIKYKNALVHCLSAMKTAESGGCLDHLDSAPDGGAFWHEAKKLGNTCFGIR